MSDNTISTPQATPSTISSRSKPMSPKRTCRRTSRSPSTTNTGCDDLLAERAGGERNAFDLSGGDLLRDGGGIFELADLDGRLLRLALGLVERLVRDQAVLPQLLALCRAMRKHLHVEAPALGPG